MRKINELGLHIIKQMESLRLVPYYDGGGVLTVGWGHTAEPGETLVTITEERATELLRHDVREAEEAVERLVKVPLNDNQFSALVSFTFNIGEGQLSTSTILRLLNQKKYVAAAGQFERWVYDNGKKETGLIKRRAIERFVFTL